MTWLKNIESVISKHFEELFSELGLESYESSDGPGMGAIVKFKSDFFRLMMINDKGLISVDLSSPFGKESFNDLDLFYALVKLDKLKKVSGFERNRILGSRLNHEEQVRFLREYKDELKEALSKKLVKKTIKSIEALGSERSIY